MAPQGRLLIDMRQEYEQDGLSEETAGNDPIALFVQWLDDAVAAGLAEPNAMTLATATADGRPSARIVLLKGVSEAGFTFFTNYQSRKAAELAANPRAALCFLWKELERQVRIEGLVHMATAAESDEYFRTRPANSRLGAWASKQSAPIADRAALETAMAAFRAKFGDDVPRPENWGGYILWPEAIEFWQGRPSRLHDRLEFQRRDGQTWSRRRLSP